MVVLSSFNMPDVPVKFEQRNTRAVLDKKDLGLGTLYITERSVCWKEQGEVGFCLSHTHITLHAISNDKNLYPRECVYIMIDTHVTIPGQTQPQVQALEEASAEGQDDSDKESEADISELILIPGDPSALSPMYEALKECQALNPDEEFMDEVEEQEEDDDDIYEDADEDVQRDYGGDTEMGDIGAGGDTAFYDAHLRLARAGLSLRHLLEAHNVDYQNWQEFVENLRLNDFGV